MPARSQPPDDSGDDSDIQEVLVIPANRNKNAGGQACRQASPIMKRRRSSPLMDPIPTYNPTPLHILEQRARGSSPQADSYQDCSANFEYDPGSHDGSFTNTDDYIPLLEPSPHVLSCETETNYTAPSTLNRVTARHAASSSEKSHHIRRKNSSDIPRPVSSALAQAVSRRKNSMSLQQKEKEKTAPQARQSNDYAQQPVMWSPKLPSPEKESASGMDSASTEDYTKYQSVVPAKQRVAHKPIIPRNKNNRPRVPIGTSRKVPLAFRAKYLDVIINEYLNTGHTEEESFEMGLNEEKSLAERALSKMIYVNLVAGFKKKLREKVGVSTLPQNEDPKFIDGNKVVSHEEILTGKVKGTFSIEKKRKMSDPSGLSEEELYDRLSRYVMPSDELAAYGYPYRDPDNPKLRMAPLGKDGQKVPLRQYLASSYTCERCAKVYRVASDGMPLATVGKCIFHPGHLWNVRISRALEKRYSCCKGDQSAGGCSSNVYHVHKGELELENYMGYVETQPKPDREPDKHGLYALDCEMCYTTYGLELTRVTVINHKHDVVYEKLVKPNNPILDYNTKFSGIKPGDLDSVDTTLADVQRDLLSMFSDKTILVGHSLDSDMKALKIFHKRFIDTAQLFPHKKGLPFKRALRTLMIENLQVIIQEDAGHDSKEDACAAFRLVMWKAKTDVPFKVS